MSLIKANAVQVGQSPTATQNFTLAVPSSPDGTIKLARGNSGATTQDVMNVSNAGVVSFPQGLGNISNSTAIATGSTTARSLANRFADVVNVKDFGAVGDGVADDTAAIQAAINYSSSNNKTLNIPKSSVGYLCKNEIVLNNNTTIDGYGKLIAGPISGFTFSNPTHAALVYSEDKDNITIRNISFDLSNWTALPAGSASLRTIECRRGDNIVVDGCQFVTTGGSTAFIGCTDAKIQNTHTVLVKPNDSSIVHADAVIDCWVEFAITAKQFIVTNNTIIGNTFGKWGIMMTGLIFGSQVMKFEQAVISNNIIEGMTYDGIWVFGRDTKLSNASITGNCIRNCRKGIALSDAQNCSITGNSIFDTTIGGIHLFSENTVPNNGVQGTTVSGNSIKSNGAGISIWIEDTSYFNIISSNTITGTPAFGIVIDATSTQNLVSSNIIETATSNKYLYSNLNNFVNSQYTPTLTNIQNVNSSSALRFRFESDNQITKIWGRFTVTPNSIGYTQIGISVPVSGNTGFGNIIGLATSSLIPIGIDGSSIADTIRCEFTSTSTSLITMSIFLQYNNI